MYIFKHQRDPENRFDTTDITFEVDTVSLAELVQAFEHFLKASGFSFDGQLEVVSDEEQCG